MGTMTLAIATALSITATGPSTPVECHISPFLGGQNHNALLINNAAVGGSGVVNIEGNNAQGPTAPASNDPGWFTVAALTSASPLESEILLPLWIRANVATAGTGTVSIQLEGVQ